MTGTRVASLAILSAILTTSTVFAAADFSTYRGLKFGMSPSAAAEQPGTRPMEARFIHRQPATIQEMDWQPRTSIFSITADPSKSDPVKEAVLSFLNGELYRIIVTYDRYKVEGMTAEDLIEGISATYGAPTRPTTPIAFHSHYSEAAAVLARWEDADYSYNLVNAGDRATFALVLFHKRMDALAQTAIAEAVRMNAQSAPQREIEKKKQRDEDARLVLEKARAQNKPNFRP